MEGPPRLNINIKSASYSETKSPPPKVKLFKARTNEENDVFGIDQTFNIPVHELSDENSSNSSSESY